MDFMDPPVPVVEAKPESIDSTLTSGAIPESIPADRVAHVYEIPPGDAYPGTLSMVIRPDERLQPMYGIFLPISNGQYPHLTGMNSKAIATPVHSEAKTHESTQSIPSTQGIQHQPTISANQSTVSNQTVQHQKITSNIQANVSNQGAQHQQNVSLPSNQSAVSNQGFQHQQNISSNQTVITSQGIPHQHNVSVQPISTQVVQQTVSGTLSPVSNQGVQQTISNIQSGTTNLVNQHIITTTQSSVSTQGIQQMVSNTQSTHGVQSVASNAQTVSQGIQQNMTNTQSAIPTHGIQQSIPGTQHTQISAPVIQQSMSATQPTQISTTGIQQSMPIAQSSQGIQQNLSLVQPTQISAQGIQQTLTCTQPMQVSKQVIQNMPCTQPAQISTQGIQQNIPNIQSTQGIQHSQIPTQGIQQTIPGAHHTQMPTTSIQHQNINVIPSAVSSQGIQHTQNAPCIQSSVPIQNIQQQKEPAICVEHHKAPVGQIPQSVQNIPTQIQEKAPQSAPAGQSNTPPQSQTSVKTAPNVALQHQIVAGEPVMSHIMPTSVPLVQSQAQESQSMQTHIQAIGSAHSQAASIPPVSQISVETVSHSCIVSSVKVSDTPQTLMNQESVIQPPIQQISTVPIPTVGAQAVVNTAEASHVTNSKLQDSVVPSQVVQNHLDAKELGTPPSTVQEASQDTPISKNDINGEESESVPSGTSTVAIDNKIEQAMDLVKSHLMFAVREEVDVLKEKITELMDRISQLEYENGFLRANASQQTLEQLNQSQLLQQQQQQQQQNQPSVISVNSVPQQSSLQPQQLNIQDQQPTS